MHVARRILGHLCRILGVTHRGEIPAAPSLLHFTEKSFLWTTPTKRTRRDANATREETREVCGIVETELDGHGEYGVVRVVEQSLGLQENARMYQLHG